MKALISILIPAFNAERFVARAIRSALAQTWPRCEIIVVDDGSTDGTLAIAQGFESRTVTVVSQPHQGASAARNHALALSRGDYIQWLDADDQLGPDKIERQLGLSVGPQPHDVLLCCPWSSFLERPERAWFEPTSLWCDLPPIEWLLRKMEHNAYMQTGTWLVSRQLTEAAGQWDPHLSHDDDGEYFCRVILRSTRVAFVPDARVYYRRPGMNGLSFVGQSSAKLDSKLRAMQLQIGHLLRMADTSRARAACAAYLQTSLLTFYPERPDLIARAHEIARSLGYQLEAPRFPPKYAWIAPMFGADVAKWVSLRLPRARESVQRAIDGLRRFEEAI